MSDRYRMVAAMMDDPLNRACVHRELARRKHDRELLSPPLENETGEIGLVPIRSCLASPDPSTLSNLFLFSVFNDGSGFFVATEDGEIGPFDVIEPALSEMLRVAEDMGYRVLDTIPWGEVEDLYPMHRKNHKQ